MRALAGPPVAEKVRSSVQNRKPWPSLPRVRSGGLHHHEYEGLEAVFLDEFSSAVSFDGWTMRFGAPTIPDYTPLPVSPPKTYLLREGWKEYGRIDPFERPASYRW